MAELRVVRSELVLGAEGSGKAARAEALCAAWLAQSPRHRAVRIADEPLELAHAVGRYGLDDTLVVVDCLTMGLMAQVLDKSLESALASCAGPVVLVSNEPLPLEFDGGRDARVFLAALGDLNRAAAAACERVTLMSAGLPMLLKGQS